MGKQAFVYVVMLDKDESRKVPLSVFSDETRALEEVEREKSAQITKNVRVYVQEMMLDPDVMRPFLVIVSYDDWSFYYEPTHAGKKLNVWEFGDISASIVIEATSPHDACKKAKDMLVENIQRNWMIVPRKDK